MEIIYRALDGKEFEDEYDCEEYEQKLVIQNLGRDLTMVNDEFESVTCGDDVYYFVVRSRVARDKIKELLDSYLFERNEEISLDTVYGWDENVSKFVSIHKTIAEKTKEIEKLKRIIDKINEKLR